MARIDALVDIVGSDNVLEDPEILEKYSSDMSIVMRVRPKCLVKPKTTEEVQGIVKWANKTFIPLIPVSSGPPHFRGDTVPSVGGAVIVELSRMKRILRVDHMNRVAMVEPGVTFGELQEELDKVGMNAYMPLCPRDTKSIVGSMLEREPMTMPAHQWDCSDPFLCAEIVFGTGNILRSGDAAGPDKLEEQWKLGRAQMVPFGLSQFEENKLISGAQGTIGIVTWATLKCRYSSELNRTFFVMSQDIEPLIDIYYQLTRIRLADNSFILNNLNLAALIGRNAEEIDELKREISAWVLVVSFEGYGELPEEKVAYQEADFKEMLSRSSYGLKAMDRLPGADANKVSELLSRPSDGIPWKLKYKEGCQEIFFLTTLDKVPEFIERMSYLCKKCGHPLEDIGSYIQMVVQGTSCHCEFDLYYDPGNSTSLEKVKWLVTDGCSELANMGGFFSRPYGAWADIALGRAAGTVRLQRKVKDIFDPNGILNPGKLCF